MKPNWLNQPTEAGDAAQVARETFHIDRLSSAQIETIAHARDKRDVLMTAPTGSGKSLAYQIPALLEEKGSTTLVVSPLIALMRDQANKLKTLGLPVMILNSQPDVEKVRDKILAKIRARTYALLYLSPEQLQKTDVREALNAASVPRMAVDEAHCITQWGHDFRPEYGRLGDVRDALHIPNVSAFTATASLPTRNHIRSSLHMREAAEVRVDGERKNLRYHVEQLTTYEEKIARLIAILRKRTSKGQSALIYTARRTETQPLSEKLQAAGFEAGFYHGELDGETRKMVETAFMTDALRLLVATNAFGMGVDKPNIRTVIHMDAPQDVESYLQETGRAGRDGKPAECHLLTGPKDFELLQHFLMQKAPQPFFVSCVFEVVKEMCKKTMPNADGLYALNLHALRARFRKRKKITRPGEKDYIDHGTKVNASLEILQQSGALSRQNGYWLARDFNEDVKRQVADECAVREQAMRYKMEKVKQYLDDESPSQRLLLDLLETEA